MNVLSYFLQFINYTFFMLIIWFFSLYPSYQHIAPNESVITLAFSHAGKPISECRRRTTEELAALPPNMRVPMDCPRQRSPIEVELTMDDQVIFHETFAAKGLKGDWGVDVFKEFTVPSGAHELKMRLKDSVQTEGFGYSFEKKINLKPQQLLLVDFKQKQGFVIQ